MKKLTLIAVFVLSSLMALSQIPNYRYDVDVLLDRTDRFSAAGDTTRSDRDTIFFVSDVFTTDACDSLFFAWELKGDSTLIGTPKDSFIVYLRIQWVSPSNWTNTGTALTETVFATQDSVFLKAKTLTGNYITAKAPATYNGMKTKAKVWVRIVNVRTVAQAGSIKVYAIKRWVD
jgi:hypothetical protein